MKRIYFIRHGESDWNKKKRVQGQKNTKLTEKGRKQAHLLGKKLNKLNIDIIYSSDLDRAKETSEIINEYINSELILSKMLREMNFGNWTGKLLQNIKENKKEDYNKWMTYPELVKFDSGESLEDVKKRMNKFFKEILKNDMYKDIAIVSHGSTIKMGIIALLKAENSLYKNMSIHNTSLTVIELRDYNNVLLRFNDTSHLEGVYEK